MLSVRMLRGDCDDWVRIAGWATLAVSSALFQQALPSDMLFGGWECELWQVVVAVIQKYSTFMRCECECRATCEETLVAEGDVFFNPLCEIERIILVTEDERMLEELGRIRTIRLLLLQAVRDELHEFW